MGDWGECKSGLEATFLMEADPDSGEVMVITCKIILIEIIFTGMVISTGNHPPSYLFSDLE